MSVKFYIVSSLLMSGLVCKLDFKKAYDMVGWDFLLYIMARMGLGKNGVDGFIAVFHLISQYW